MAPKTTCPVSRSQFTAKAKPLVLTIDGTRIAVPVKDFSTGSMGWYANGKTTIEVDGVLCTVQMGLTFTVVGSKELPPATSTNGTPVAATAAPVPSLERLNTLRAAQGLAPLVADAS